MNIITIKEFPEYTDIHYTINWELSEVARCNSVCADCWVMVAKTQWIELEWFATTFRKWVCDLCKQHKHITGIRHYNK